MTTDDWELSRDMVVEAADVVPIYDFTNTPAQARAFTEQDYRDGIAASAVTFAALRDGVPVGRIRLLTVGGFGGAQDGCGVGQARRPQHRRW